MPGVSLTPLEVASGVPLGHGAAGRADLPRVARDVTPLRALEDAVLPAVAKPPCLVSFSGGKDSSLVLAVATRVARREGLPAPIPVTLRFPRAPGSDESDWQEEVVRHVGLDEWERREHTDEFDYLGPLAQGLMRRHGLLYPANSAFFVPQLEAATGGTLLTGCFGDSVFHSGWWARAWDVLARRVRPQPRDVLRIGLLVMPRPIKRAVLRPRVPLYMPWLRPRWQEELRRAAAWILADPPRWETRVRGLAAARFVELQDGTWRALAGDAGCVMTHPLIDARFLVALGRAGGTTGFGDRTAVLRALFSDVLPPAVISRPTKADFGQVYWGEESRRFAREWDGQGLDPDLVDPEALRWTWLHPTPPDECSVPLQAAWLAANGSSVAGPPQDEEVTARPA